MMKIIISVVLLTATITLSLPHDKLLHVGISGLLSSTISSFFGKSAGFLATLSIGVAKEVHDVFYPGTPDVGDIAADIFGDVLGISFLSDKKYGILIIWEF